MKKFGIFIFENATNEYISYIYVYLHDIIP